VVSNLLNALHKGGGLFLLMLYNTLHLRRYLGRMFIKTLHSLEGLMIIDSLLIFSSRFLTMFCMLSLAVVLVLFYYICSLL